MAESTINTYFCRKPRCLDDLLEERRRGPVHVQVEQIIQLTYEQYQHFLSHIWEDMPFFEAHKRVKYCDSKGVSRCLLVTTRSRRDGILVDCQGFNFARYSCYVSDKHSLDLRDVPVDHYDLKLRQPRSQRER